MLQKVASLKDFYKKEWYAGTWLLLQLKRSNFSVADLKYAFKVPNAPKRPAPKPNATDDEKEEAAQKWEKKIKEYEATCEKLRGDAAESANLINYIISGIQNLVADNKLSNGFLEKDEVKKEATEFGEQLRAQATNFLQQLEAEQEELRAQKEARRLIANEKAARKREAERAAKAAADAAAAAAVAAMAAAPAPVPAPDAGGAPMVE